MSTLSFSGHAVFELPQLAEVFRDFKMTSSVNFGQLLDSIELSRRVQKDSGSSLSPEWNQSDNLIEDFPVCSNQGLPTFITFNEPSTGPFTATSPDEICWAQ